MRKIKNTFITVRITEPLKNEIISVADAEEVSVSAIVRRSCAESIRAYKQRNNEAQPITL